MNYFWSILFQITILLLKQKCRALDPLLSDGEEEDSKGKLLLVGEILLCKVFLFQQARRNSHFQPFQLYFWVTVGFFYLNIYSTLEEQIKNTSDCLTLFLLSYLLMLSWFMWVRRQPPLALLLLLSLRALSSGPAVLPT